MVGGRRLHSAPGAIRYRVLVARRRMGRYVCTTFLVGRCSDFGLSDLNRGRALETSHLIVIGLGLAVAIVSVMLRACLKRIRSDPEYIEGLGCLPEIQVPLVFLLVVAASWVWGVAGFVGAFLFLVVCLLVAAV